MTQQTAFVGMGIMGAPMAQNLLKAGYPVTVHTRTKSKARPVIDAGAVWADTPAQAANEADIVITCVTDTPDVQAVLLGEGGVIESARPGRVCIDMSTISPEATKDIAAVLSSKGMVLLDAPISGGEIGAIEAKLSIMVGGPKERFEQVLPVLEAAAATAPRPSSMSFASLQTKNKPYSHTCEKYVLHGQWSGIHFKALPDKTD